MRFIDVVSSSVEKKKRDLKAAYATLKKNSSADGKFYGAC